MLEDWEQRELWAIEYELSTDEELAGLLAGPTDRQLWWLAACRHFYPAGYLACAVAYMLFSISSTHLASMAGAGLAGVAACLVGLVRAGMDGIPVGTQPPGPGR
jgi:hypothetical protein